MKVMCRKTGKWIIDDLEGKVQAVRHLVSQVKGEVVLDRDAGIDYLEHVNKASMNLLEMEIMELIDRRIDGLEVFRVKGSTDKEGVRVFDIQVLYKGKVINI